MLAKKLAAQLGCLHNSITNGEGNICAYAGEITVADYLHGVSMARLNKFSPHYDVVLDEWFIDVKTTRCTSYPKPYYNCHVADFNTKQECHGYVFTRVHKDLKTCWILGFLPKDEFYKVATFHKKGDVDPDANGRGLDSHNGCFPADCYSLQIQKLRSFST